jgi:hypothetical protein
MRDLWLRAALVASALGVLAAACSGDTEPTTTRFIPPTSEDVFELTTTTSRPPGPLDPVFIESLGVTVDFPRDWEFRTDGLLFGRASAVFRADNGAGGLIVVGDVADVIAEGAEPRAARPDDLAPTLATLLDTSRPQPEFEIVGEPQELTVAGMASRVATYAVTEPTGSVATMTVVVYEDTFPVVFIAVIYQSGFPPDRIDQASVFESIVVE